MSRGLRESEPAAESARGLRIQFMSDLHLELFPGFRVRDVLADVLVLAGDIGDPASAEYRDFLADCSQRYREVILVAGNHEAYGRSWPDTLTAAASAAARAGPNVRFLHRATHDLVPGRLRVAGTTLWSHVPAHASSDVDTFISDYRCIAGLRSAADTNDLHAQDVAFLRGALALAEADSVTLLVVTHHAPWMRGTSAPAHGTGRALNHAFATDLPDLLRPPVAAWIFGHTHHTSRQEVNGVVLASCQRGYAHNPAESSGFRPDLGVLDLDSPCNAQNGDALDADIHS